MRNFFTELLRQLQGIWKRLDGGQRLVVVAVLAAAVVGLGAIVWFAGRPSYENVFQSIDAEELRDARRALGQAAVPFITDDSGQGILVDRARIAQANAALSANGLRGNSQSRNNPLLSTMIADSETKASLLDDAARARTQAAIRALDGVTAVTVSSMRLRRSPFSGRDRDTQPRATVALRLKAGVAFESVAKAAASQAASDLGVPMTNVEVVNASSHQRWTYDPDREAGGGAGEFMAQQRSLGDARTTMAQQALDALYPGKTLVTVNIELDPDWMIVSEKVLPVEPLLKTDKTQKDNTENGAGNAGASGDPSATASTEAAAAAPKNSAKKETRDREYVTDYGERRHGKLAPEIKRLSVGLLYDKSLEQKDGFKKDDLARIVKSIVGWDPKRDLDEAFSTMVGEFPAEPPAEAPVGPSLADKALRWAPVAGQVLGVLLVVLFLKGLFKRSSAASGRVAAADPAEEQVTPEQQAQRMRREIERAIVADPASLAKMLESWLAEQQA